MGAAITLTRTHDVTRQRGPYLHAQPHQSHALLGTPTLAHNCHPHAQVLRRYKLPATETLLAQFACLVPGPSGVTRGDLNVTRHFVCWGPRQGHGHDAVVMWSRVEGVMASTAAGYLGVELHLVDNRKLAFSSFTGIARDEVPTRASVQPLHTPLRPCLSGPISSASSYGARPQSASSPAPSHRGCRSSPR